MLTTASVRFAEMGAHHHGCGQKNQVLENELAFYRQLKRVAVLKSEIWQHEEHQECAGHLKGQYQEHRPDPPVQGKTQADQHFNDSQSRDEPVGVDPVNGGSDQVSDRRDAKDLQRAKPDEHRRQ